MSNMKETLEFVDELPGFPFSKGYVGKYERLLEPLIERPGEWARILVGPNEGGVMRGVKGAISSLQHGRYRMPPGEWEFARRTMPDGEVHGFARYMGNGAP